MNFSAFHWVLINVISDFPNLLYKYSTMSVLKQTAIASDETKHSADMEWILLHEDLIYTAADDGKVKVRELSLRD